MCGIAGLMTRDGRAPDASALAAMSAALRHRGPDGDGTYVAGDVGMVHRRLAIIDLATGDQPLGQPGGAVLVANGEIYNYLELRRELGEARFATLSDCEPPLHLYRADGAAYAERLRGMYAIALHDPTEGRLLLSRDPFGIKPLYYTETDKGLAFASEIGAFVAAGLVRPRVVPARRDELLQLQFTTGRETVYEGVMRVLPGETIVVAGGRIVERRRIEALPAGGPAESETVEADETKALEALDAALLNSVEMHQRADVPYGMFLSGGIDSAALLALMARLNDHPVRAFTAGFAGAGVPDERDRARALARAVGAEHVEVVFDESDFWTLLPRVVACMDDPTADYAVLPTYKLAAEAGRELKVVLCGEGGDELFAGYGRYRSLDRPWWQGGRRIRARGTFDGLGVLRGDPSGWRDGIGASEIAEARPGRTGLQAAQAVDCADWLPNDLLIKLDRCLMAHGVEGRTPFLDPAVAAVGFGLADRLKIRDGLGKWLLRRWLADALPEAAPYARKRGFTVPVGEWIAAHGARLGPLVARQPCIAEIAAPRGAARLFGASGKRPRFAAWTLLYYALWHRCHVEGGAMTGDVFELLADNG
ncbi:MAG: asparagine synthase (glutamine-hydrolyzing) [Alphaproteobacteria bacterium]